MHSNPSRTFSTYNEIKLPDNSMASGPQQQTLSFTNHSYHNCTTCSCKYSQWQFGVERCKIATPCVIGSTNSDYKELIKLIKSSEFHLNLFIPLFLSFKSYMSWACNYRCTHTSLNMDVVVFQLTQLMLDEKFSGQS